MYGKISRLTTEKIETKYTISKPGGGKMAKGKNKRTNQPVSNNFFLRWGGDKVRRGRKKHNK